MSHVSQSGSDAAARWRDQLAAWALPDHILRSVPDSPWSIPKDVFARRADESVATPTGPSYERAAEALGPAGTVLDVGPVRVRPACPWRRGPGDCPQWTATRRC